MFAGIAWSQGLEDAWSKVATTVPQVIFFLFVLLIGSFVTRIITKGVRRVAERLKIDQLLERAGIGSFINRAGLTSSQLVSKSVKYFLTFVVVTTAFSVFGPDNPVSKLLDRFVLLLPRVVVAAAIIVITGLVARFAQNTLIRLSDSAEGVPGVSVPSVTIKAAPIAIWVVGTFAAIDQLGIAANTVRTVFTALVAMIVGIGIVAIGGGGIAAMRPRWDGWLSKWDQANATTRTVDPESAVPMSVPAPPPMASTFAPPPGLRAPSDSTPRTAILDSPQR